MTLDGRVTVPGRRWVTGEESRRRVHELRAAVDAVAVGMGTVRADAPRLDARDVPVARQPRRLAFGRGPLPAGSELELRSGRSRDELAALAAEGVQSLLLEGGPTLATAFLEAGLVDQAARLRRADARRAAGRAMLGDARRRRSSSAPLERERSATTCSSRRDLASPEWTRLEPRVASRRCSRGSCARSGRVVAVEGDGRRADARRRGARAPRRRPRSAARSRSTASASPPRRSTATRSASTPCRRRSRGRRSAQLAPGDAVNVEPALRAGEPLGGHFVQGHVDGVGTVRLGRAGGRGAAGASSRRRRTCCATASRRARSRSTASRSPSPSCTTTRFAVALVPHTLAATTLGGARAGRRVNLEVDVLAKYVERLLGPRR